MTFELNMVISCFQDRLFHVGASNYLAASDNPGEKNGVIARNCASAINAPNYAVFKTLYLLDCVI